MAEDEALERLGDELVGVVDDAAPHGGPSDGRMLRLDPNPHRLDRAEADRLGRDGRSSAGAGDRDEG